VNRHLSTQVLSAIHLQYHDEAITSQSGKRLTRGRLEVQPPYVDVGTKSTIRITLPSQDALDQVSYFFVTSTFLRCLQSMLRTDHKHFPPADSPSSSISNCNLPSHYSLGVYLSFKPGLVQLLILATAKPVSSMRGRGH
jgi:hypothetical protein